MNESVELHLAILGSRQCYQATARNYTTNDVKNAYLKKEEVLAWCLDLNQKGYVTWLSINDKEKDCKEGVTSLNDFWLDIDARPKGVDDRTATEQELHVALDRATKLKNYIENQYAALGFMADSGNGFNIHFPLPRFELSPELRLSVNAKVKTFAVKASAYAQVEIDKTYDISRKTTLIGTPNLKIPDKPLATKWDKDLLIEGIEAALKYVENARMQNTNLLDTILKTEPEKEPKLVIVPNENHLKIEQLIDQDQKLHDLLKGDYQKYNYKSRSEAEEAVLVKLVMEGFSDAEINSVMENCHVGKWQEEQDGYRTLSLEHAREQANKYIAKKNREEQAESGELNPVVLAKGIMQEYRFIVDQKTAKLFYYDKEEGVYTENTEQLIKREIAKILDDDTRAKYYVDVEFWIKNTSPITQIDTRPELIVVANGILNVLTRELKPFSPDFYIAIKLPVKYDSKAKCPTIGKFLEQVLDEPSRKLAQEFIGYCLYRKIIFHKALLLVGLGSNGKSVLIDLNTALLGENNTIHQTIQNLCFNRFSLAELYNKLANFSADLPSNELEHTGIFKQIVGGDRLTGEPKHQKPFYFWPFAKLLFSCNVIPPIVATESNFAYYRRWIILEFLNMFTGKADNKNLRAELTTPEELSGYLNYALEGLRRLMDQQDFSENTTVEETRKAYIKRSNSCQAFIEEKVIVTDEYTDFVFSDLMYRDYITYCHVEKLPTQPKAAFTKTTQQYCNGAEHCRIRPDKDSSPLAAWRYVKLGVRVKEEKPKDNSQKTLDHTEKESVPPVLAVLPFQIKSGILKCENTEVKIENIIPNSGTGGTPGTEQKERTCGHCVLWHKPGCSYPDAESSCVAQTNKYAADCRNFIPQEGGT
jgi:putative DNA primase/helicase